MGWSNNPSSGGGGSGDVIAANSNNFTNVNTFTNNGTSSNGRIVLDLRDHPDTAGYRVWPFQVLDPLFSDTLHPGNPRAGFNSHAQFFTNNAIVMSAEFVGDVTTENWYPLAAFDKTTAGAGVGELNYAGGYGAVLSLMNDIDSATIQITCPPALPNAFHLLAGTRNPGAGVGTAKFGIDQDGAIFMGSSEPIYRSAGGEPGAVGYVSRPYEYLEPIIWRDASLSPGLNGNIKLYGDVNIQKLNTPAGLAVAAQGTTGATTYGYRITAAGPTGESLAATEVTIANGNATLSGSNFNRITWTRQKGANSYKIYRTTGGATQGLIGTVLNHVPNMRFDDTGLSATGSVPTLNTTGNLIVTGKTQGTPFVVTLAITGYMANGGTLTTRTSDTVGTVTTTSTSTMVTGALADLFWSGGKRIGVVLGTVSGTSVPFSGGSGDILPATSTAIRVTTHGTFWYSQTKGKALSSLGIGFRTMGSGSILGMSFHSIINNPGGSTLSGTPNIQMYSNATELTGCSVAVGSALSGTVDLGRVSNTAGHSFARGQYTWSGNTTLNPVIDLEDGVLGSATWDIILTIVMCYD